MRRIDRTHTGDLTVSDETVVLQGVVTGDVLVVDGGHLKVLGVVAGKAVVREGGRLVVHGVVRGGVHVEGGDVDITGVVASVRYTAGSGGVAVGAMVGGRTVSDDGSLRPPSGGSSIDDSTPRIPIERFK